MARKPRIYFVPIRDKKGNIIGSEEISYKGLSNHCYFCDFCTEHNLKPHQHHIIRKADGGTNTKDNLLPLCPNHHALLHNANYIIVYNPKTKYFFIVEKYTRKSISPTYLQRNLKRDVPKCIINNKNLIIYGNLNTKSKVFINPKKSNKKIDEKVSNEKGVQSY